MPDKTTPKPKKRKSIFIDKKKTPKPKLPPILKGVEKPSALSTLRSVFFFKKMLQNKIPMKTAVTLVPMLKMLPKQHRRLVLLMLVETIGVHPLVRKAILKYATKLKL